MTLGRSWADRAALPTFRIRLVWAGESCHMKHVDVADIPTDVSKLFRLSTYDIKVQRLPVANPFPTTQMLRNVVPSMRLFLPPTHFPAVIRESSTCGESKWLGEALV